MSVATQSLFISKEMKALASPTTVAMEKSVSCLRRKGTSRLEPCFCVSGFTEKEWRAGPLLNLSGRSSSVVQKCACVRALFILALLVIYKLKQIIVETFATMEKGCL